MWYNAHPGLKRAERSPVQPTSVDLRYEPGIDSQAEVMMIAYEVIQETTALPTRPLTLHFAPAVNMTQEQFYDFCQLNPELRLERTQTGDIIVMAPAGGETGGRNAGLTAFLYLWARQDGRGVSFDSSTGFVLPNGATRSPDAAWVRRERLESLSAEAKRRFLPLCPDFVVELVSPTDNLPKLLEKMAEYMENGAQLGWLLTPTTQTVYIFRPDQAPAMLVNPASISGKPELPGFTLVLAEIWNPGF